MSGVQTNELRLKINAGAAESGAKKFKTAIESIKRAVAGLERSTDGAFKNLKQGMQVNPGRGAEAALKGTAKAASQTEQATKRLATSVQNSMTTAAAQTAKLKAQFAALADGNGIAKAEQALARFHTHAGKAGNTASLGAAKADYRATVAGLQAEARASQEAIKAQALHAKELHNLKSKYDPLFASSKLYETQLHEINQAEAAGVLTTVQAADARERAAKGLESGVVSMNKYGQSVRVSSAHMAAATQGVVAQFNDIGVMLASGQSPLILAMQQGTQLSQTLNGLGGGSGSVLAALKGGFLSMLNPISLITIGSIALGAALFQAFTKGKEKTKSFTESMSDAGGALNELRSATEAMATGNLRELRREYGEVNEELDRHLERLRKVAELEAATKNSDMAASLREALTSDGNMFTNDVDAIRRAFDTTNDRARSFIDLLGQIQNARTFSEQAEAVTKLRQAVEEVTGGLDKSQGSARGFLANLVRAEDMALKLLAAMNDTGESANTLATELSEGAIQVLELNKIDMSDGLSDATKQAAQLAANLNISLNAAYNLKNLQDSKVYSGRGGDPRQFGDGYTPPSLTTTTPRGGGGGGASPRDELTRTTNAMREQALAQTALRDGRYQSEEAARLWAQAMLEGNGTLDAQTQAALANIDVLAQRNETLRDAPEDFAQEMGQGVESALANGINSAFRGDGNALQNFFKSVENNIAGAASKALAQKITSGLGLDTLFNAGGTTAAMQMQAGIVSGSAQGASLMAQAIATGSAAGGAGGMGAGMLGGGGGGGFWSTAISVVGGLFGFDEGVANTSNPGAWQKLPHYAEGTANTSSGIPAVLHPNEAVVPLSRGRKIPVDMGEGAQGGVSVGDIVTNVTVEGDASTDSSIEMAQIVGETVDGRIRTILAEERAYGGTLNPRGGF